MLSELFLFILAVIIFFIIPGNLILDYSRFQFNIWEKIILGSVLGLVCFSLVGYLFIVLNIKWLILIVFAIADFFYIKKYYHPKISINFLPKKQLIILTIFLIIGVIGQLLVIAPSGIERNGDIVFWSSHAHDSSWHIALMNELQRGFPIQNPALSGNRLVNYHFFSDIAPSYFNFFFKFSSLDLYFRFFPLIYAVLFASLAYLLGKKITNSFWGGFWSLIFADFCGSAGFIITLLRNHTLGGEELFWSSQPQSTIGNPPQIAALILLLAFLYLFIIFLEKTNKYLYMALTLIGGSLIVFKVYAGIALLGSLFMVGIWRLIKDRKLDILTLFIPSALLSSILYLPNSSQASSFLIFQPWWYIRTLVVSSDRLDKLNWELKRQTYLADHNFKRVIQLELEAFLIFFFGNLWVRTLSLLQPFKNFTSIFTNYFNLLFLAIISLSFIFPMLFLQKGVASNTSQFFQYFLLLTGVTSAVVLVRFGEKIKSTYLKIFLSGLIILLSLPTQLGLLMQFYSRAPFTKIDATEKKALNFLKQNTTPESVIINPPFNQYLNLNESTPPIWAWSDTDYIGAFGERSTYLSDQEQVDIMGYDYHQRKNIEEKLFNEVGANNFTQLADKTGANYLYFPKLESPKVDLTKTPFVKVFENSEIEIWKIR